jgi:hypothetical protein
MYFYSLSINVGYSVKPNALFSYSRQLPSGDAWEHVSLFLAFLISQHLFKVSTTSNPFKVGPVKRKTSNMEPTLLPSCSSAVKKKAFLKRIY